MTKSTKELAFLRDLYVDPDWTLRFSELTDAHFGFTDDRSLLYINAGTGNHALAIGSKADRGAIIRATCEDRDLLTIAREKAVATKSIVEFSADDYEEDSFDAVIADASFVDPVGLREFTAKSARFAEIGGSVVIFSVSSGSFGEIFSLLWEAMMDGESDLSLAERLITELPTVSAIEEYCVEAGLEKVETHVSNEVFEFKDGAEFIASPLVADFLMPRWFEGMSENETERVRERLAQLIDDEDAGLTFRFSVKAVLAVGEKA